MTKITSDGTTASYYQLPEGATELQHLISHRNLNAQDGEIFRAIYRKGMASHSDELRDARKVLFYAQAEVERLEKLRKPIIRELYTEAAEARMDVVGQNGNTAEHYPADGWIPTNGEKLDLPDGTLVDIKFSDGYVSTGHRAGLCYWTQDGDAEDIAHYRIHRPTTAVQGEPVSHDWDDQDKCRRCGDRDWYASATCSAALAAHRKGTDQCTTNA